MENNGSDIVLKLKTIKKNKNKFFLFLFLVSVLLFYTLGFTYIIGRSMENTMSEGDIILVSRNYDFDDVKRGDIAVLDVNYRENMTRIIKRIVAISGDKVEFLDNKLYINDELQIEKYIKEEMIIKNCIFIVPKDKIFVLGDNRNISADSRDDEIGFINFENNIYGRAIFNLSKFSKL